MNVAHRGLRVRPFERRDIPWMQQWQPHTDPLLKPYDMPRLSGEQHEQFWEYWTGKPATISLVGELNSRCIAHILLRDHCEAQASADLGIALDPAYLDRGLGTELLRLTRAYAAQTLGIEKITLEVAGWNRRALAAYAKAGFEEIDRRWIQWDTPVDVRALLCKPGNEWLHAFVRIDTGYTIVLVRMCAQKTRRI